MPKTAYTEATFDASDDSTLFTKLGGSEVTQARVTDGTLSEYVGYLWRMQDNWSGGPAQGTATEVGLELAFPASGDFGPVRAMSASYAFYLSEINWNSGLIEDRIGPCFVELADDNDVTDAHWGQIISHFTGNIRTLSFGLGPLSLPNPIRLNQFMNSWMICRLQFLNFTVSAGVYASALACDIWSTRGPGDFHFLGQQVVPPANLGFNAHHVKRIVFGFKDVEQENDFYDLRMDEIRVFRNYKATTSLGAYTLAPMPRRRIGAVRLTLNAGVDPNVGIGDIIDNLRAEDGCGLLIMQANGVGTHRIDLDSIETLSFITLEDDSGSLDLETSDELALEG